MPAMRRTIQLLALTAATVSAQTGQIDIDAVFAAGDPPTFPGMLALGNTWQGPRVDPQANLSSRSVEIEKRTGADCTPYLADNPTVQGPSNDTVDAFLSYQPFADAAMNAPTPLGYVNTFTNYQAENLALGFMGSSVLASYDPNACATLCNQHNECAAFNIAFERVPTLNTAPSCPDPPSATWVKCTLWGGPVNPGNAINTGQWRDSFEVVSAGSNGYVNLTIDDCSGYTGPNYLSEAAIDAPLDCSGADTFVGYQYWNDGAPFDANRCAAACNAQTQNNASFPCKFFNTFVINQNWNPQGQYCAMYSQTWQQSYADLSTFDYQGNSYTITYSYSFSNANDPGVCAAGNTTLLGCYHDQGSPRALPDRVNGPNPMTVEECSWLCANYTYFGIEYASECYCGNSMDLANSYGTADNCNMGCQGNSKQACGGGWALNIYSQGSAATSTSSVVSSTTLASSTSTSTSTSAPVNVVTTSDVTSTTTTSDVPTSTSSSASSDVTSTSDVESTSSTTSDVPTSTSSSTSDVSSTTDSSTSSTTDMSSTTLDISSTTSDASSTTSDVSSTTSDISSTTSDISSSSTDTSSTTSDATSTSTTASTDSTSTTSDTTSSISTSTAVSSTTPVFISSTSSSSAADSTTTSSDVITTTGGAIGSSSSKTRFIYPTSPTPGTSNIHVTPGTTTKAPAHPTHGPCIPWFVPFTYIASGYGGYGAQPVKRDLLLENAADEMLSGKRDTNVTLQGRVIAAPPACATLCPSPIVYSYNPYTPVSTYYSYVTPTKTGPRLPYKTPEKLRCTNPAVCGGYAPCDRPQDFNGEGVGVGGCFCGYGSSGEAACVIGDYCSDLDPCSLDDECSDGYICLQDNCCGYSVCSSTDACLNTLGARHIFSHPKRDGDVQWSAGNVPAAGSVPYEAQKQFFHKIKSAVSASPSGSIITVSAPPTGVLTSPGADPTTASS